VMVGSNYYRYHAPEGERIGPAKNGILPPKVYKAGVIASALGLGVLVGRAVAPELSHTAHIRILILISGCRRRRWEGMAFPTRGW
jgi:hypothetical protein